MACPHCGSWAVRSDRALAGRMVCGRCGQPLGLAAGSCHGSQRRTDGMGLNKRQRLRLIVLGLVAISAILAGLDHRTMREQRPPRWSDGSNWSR